MPIGYKVVDGKITICEEQRKIVEQIFTDYDSGVAAGRIAQNLKGRKICNAKGKVSWTHASIGRILENPSYLGTEYYPQLIGEELFERVQRRREKVRAELGRADHRSGRDERILFGGVIWCAECGAVCSHIQPRLHFVYSKHNPDFRTRFCQQPVNKFHGTASCQLETVNYNHNRPVFREFFQHGNDGFCHAPLLIFHFI